MTASNARPIPGNGSLLVWIALLTSVVASMGSLWLSLGMDLKACPLCLYQRTCVLGVAAVLAIGLLVQESNATPVALMALPLGVAALAVGGFHVYLERSGVLECPPGLGGVGTAPVQALVAELMVTLTILAAGARRLTPTLAALGVGLLLGILLIKSAPPLPKPKPPEGPFDMCRPVYVAPGR